MASLCVIINKEHGEDWSCCNFAASSEAQKYKIVENCVRIKSKVKLNFGLSTDFSVQLKVLLSDSLSESLSQKLK